VVEEKETRAKPEDRQDGENAAGEGRGNTPGDTNGSPAPPNRKTELPTEVRVKLRKLERMEVKYGELLKAYRSAHARVQAIEPFEASLRENTPLTSIGDPGALVEYLNQINLKSDMVLEELKRVTTDRDECKKQLEASEATAARLRQEMAESKTRTTESPTNATTADGEKSSEAVSPTQSHHDAAASDQSQPETAAKSPTPSTSRIPSFSLFSPRSKAVSPPPQEASEDLFSYESELPRLEAELQQRQGEVDDLKKKIGTLNGDLAVARESTEGMVQSLESATRELNALREAKDKFDVTKTELQHQIDALETASASEAGRTAELDKEIATLRGQKAEVSDRVQKLDRQVESLEKDNSHLRQQVDSTRQDVEILNEKLAQKDSTVKDLEDTLATYKAAEQQEVREREDDRTNKEKKLSVMEEIMNSLRGQLDSAEKTVAELRDQIQKNQDEFSRRPSTKLFGFLDDSSRSTLDHMESREEIVQYLTQHFDLQHNVSPAGVPFDLASIAPSDPGTSAAGRKKNKKKKKGKGQQAAGQDVEPEGPVKVSENLAEAQDVKTVTEKGLGPDTSELEQRLLEMKADLEAKDAAIERLSRQLKDQEALQEEIETLRQDLLHQGEGHVEARDALKDARAEKSLLQARTAELERELSEARKQHAEKETARKDLLTQLEELQGRSVTLQKDLSAAESLAAARFKDINDLKDLLAKAQPELRSLRNEVAELKSAKEDAKNKTGELSRLEARHEDIKAELKGLSKRLGDKDSHIKELQQKLEQETSIRTRAEQELEKTQSDLRSETARREEALEKRDQLSKDLATAKEESTSLRAKSVDLEEQLSAHSRQISELKEEIVLKTALHASSQSLVQSLRDQTHELNTQAREAAGKAENLEEELAEAQRMLSERTREGQTMRMLLTQAETGTETRIREMKERMDAAIEERDRIEDEASVSNRRMMREVEDARSKARDAQRALKALENDRDELEERQREWKRRREELEQIAERATKEVNDVRAAMSGLREALDETERQVQELDAQKADLRRAGDEAKERVEKLTKANKNLTEELKAAQAGLKKAGNRPGQDSGVPSSRTSLDSARARSPAPITKDKAVLSPSSTRSDTPTGLSQSTVDYVYLKNVLLQFLEQKDKGHQRQLIPVLGMLLHFDR